MSWMKFRTINRNYSKQGISNLMPHELLEKDSTDFNEPGEDWTKHRIIRPVGGNRGRWVVVSNNVSFGCVEMKINQRIRMDKVIRPIMDNLLKISKKAHYPFRAFFLISLIRALRMDNLQGLIFN